MIDKDLLATLSEEEYEDIVEEYGDLSRYIKEQTFQYKKEKPLAHTCDFSSFFSAGKNEVLQNCPTKT